MHLCLLMHDRAMLPVCRVFANGLEDRRSIPGRVILKTQNSGT